MKLEPYAELRRRVDSAETPIDPSTALIQAGRHALRTTCEALASSARTVTPGAAPVRETQR